MTVFSLWCTGLSAQAVIVPDGGQGLYGSIHYTFAWPVDSSGVTAHGSANARIETTSDSTGVYVLSVPAGDYRIMVEHEASLRGGLIGTGYGDVRDVTVSEGEWLRLDIPLQAYVMWPRSDIMAPVEDFKGERRRYRLRHFRHLPERFGNMVRRLFRKRDRG